MYNTKFVLKKTCVSQFFAQPGDNRTFPSIQVCVLKRGSTKQSEQS